MDEKEKVFTLEENFKQLEEMIEKLEDKEIGLEESFSLYEQGMKLLKQCNDQIDRVEKKVMVMNQNGALDEFS
ncbi:MAG: exodeoxyribonuclease VII small subunit [Lachnospiraceae bacterium]|nr:exodeoxyribonuclease VII small subunit [Lachnospiraceae bacterium]MDE6744752.1 exodeoxyribonuclease VII small subunit [Lachnospiraceae bacterium]